jgi:FlaA1/EpsC-like NDP-sugar epimerase
MKLKKNILLILLLDVVLLSGAFYLSHLIRFDFDIPVWAVTRFREWLVFVVAGKLASFYFFGLYKGMWRYTGINDLLNVVKASTVASLILIAVVLYTTRFEQVSRSVFIIDWCLTLMLIIGVRVVTRLCFENFRKSRVAGCDAPALPTVPLGPGPGPADADHRGWRLRRKNLPPVS